VSLLFIGAGAVQTNGEQGQMRQGEGNAISINGGRPTSNNYTLDGLVNTDTALNTPAVILSQDAIQEFRIQSETYSAEYGFSANQVNIVTKSGTNQLQGTAFEFLRNDAFDAKAPFQKALPKLRQNQFGFVLGGPIYVPKVYDGRNKTFFLANYEGWRIRSGFDQSNFTVPDLAQLSGDFSSSGLALPTQAGGTCIPTPATACMPIDSITVPYGVGVFDENAETWMISHTKNIGSRVVNNFRFGRLEPIAIQGGMPIAPAEVSALGITGVYPNLPSYARLFPTISLGSPYASVGSQGNDTTTSDIPTWQFSDTVTVIRGRHTFSSGFDYRRWLQKRDLSADFLGDFGYSNDLILSNGASGANGCETQFCGTGNAIADFLLGYYNSASTFQPGPFSPTNVAGNLNQYRFMYFAPFVQD